MTSNAQAYKQHRDEALARKTDAPAAAAPEPDVEARRAADDSWNTWASILIGGPFLALGFLLSTGLGAGVHHAALIGFAVGVFATVVVSVLRYGKRGDSPSAGRQELNVGRSVRGPIHLGDRRHVLRRTRRWSGTTRLSRWHMMSPSSRTSLALDDSAARWSQRW